MKQFNARLLKRLQMANYWLVAQVARGALALLRTLPPDKALGFADRFARRLGPWFGRHRTAIDNLRRAYPEKTAGEIEAIASDMWGNMARLAVEYIFIEQLFDFVPDSDAAGRVTVTGRETFDRIAEEKKPHILFTGHIGNFEMLPICAAAYGLEMTALFRPPNNPYIAKYIFKTREQAMGELLASKRGAALALARILERGGNIGLLVDQKFSGGIRTTFFGQPCETSPLLPKLARQYDCEVYPAHSIRLPGGRFHLTIQDKLELPRDETGAIDVDRTAQLLNDVVESWVREAPGQWMWFHKRWKLSR
jgi:KDO2-lipid IV(A) lauroyltransferase